MIVQRPAPIIDPGLPDVWWCTDCRRVVDYVDPDFKYKPRECPLWQCVELRKENSMISTATDQEPNMSLVKTCPQCDGIGWVGAPCSICKGTLFLRKEDDGRNLVSCDIDHQHRLFCPCTTRTDPDDPTSTERGRTLKILRNR